MVKEIISLREKYDPLDYLQSLSIQGINTLSIEEGKYPEMLRNIGNPPFLLYYKGDIEVSRQMCLAVVGSRKATLYGKNTARKIGNELGAKNIVVVSGMARGIDTEAHRGALDAGAKTIAVLGSGLNILYPRENARLFEEICLSGVVLSEFPLDVQPEPGNFPMRNRIISGLSRGVIVVEAQRKSGALITADFALEQGRDVFAVPGPINASNSEGTNNLIKQGAKLTSCIEDILEEYYDIAKEDKEEKLSQQRLLLLDKNEGLIIQCIGYEPVHFDELLKNSGLGIGEISTVLLKLELEGILKSMPGNYYVKI
jgi:DNA processing protein